MKTAPRLDANEGERNACNKLCQPSDWLVVGCLFAEIGVTRLAGTFPSMLCAEAIRSGECCKGGRSCKYSYSIVSIYRNSVMHPNAATRRPQQYHVSPTPFPCSKSLGRERKQNLIYRHCAQCSGYAASDKTDPSHTTGYGTTMRHDFRRQSLLSGFRPPYFRRIASRRRAVATSALFEKQ